MTLSLFGEFGTLRHLLTRTDLKSRKQSKNWVTLSSMLQKTVLNVCTRYLKFNKTVMVYIHGGRNVYGTGSSHVEAGPDILMDFDVVLVTMNYRLGALGFLSTGTDEAPENFEYLDQVMALQWVYDHISAFGGNPESVTIFGVNAGATAVSLQLASPLSKVLFHKEIAINGSSTNHFDVDNVYLTEKLARYTSCPMYNPKDVVDCLRKVPWENIVAVCSRWEPHGFATRRFNKVPILTGITQDELAYTIYNRESNTGLLNDISVDFDKYAPEMFLYSLDERANENSTGIQKFYIHDVKIQDLPLSNFGMIFSDAIIGVCRLVALARQHVDVYYYRPDFLGRHSNSWYLDADGVSRGMTVGYERNDDGEMFMVDRIAGWWTSFSQNGIPDEITWLPSNRDKVKTMVIDKDIKLGDESYLERYQLWDNMYPVRINSCENGKVAWMLTAGAVTLYVFAKSVL